MTTGTSIRAAVVAVLAVAAWTVPYSASRAAATELTASEAQAQVIVVTSDFESRSVALGIGKSVVLDFPRDIKDVLVADPKIANAVIRTSRRAYIIGNEVGQTNVFFFDAEGRHMAGLDIAVTRDLNGIRAAIRQVLPDADIRIEGIGKDGVILTGTVASQAEAQQAYDITVRLLSDATANTVAQGSKVVNAIVVRGRDQVMLKVTVAEMDRNVIKQLGINLSGSAGFGSAVVNFNTSNPFPINGTPSSSVSPGFKGITATIQAMEQVGIVRTLAEPTLAAISGESAHFLVGGSFPYPVPGSLGQPPAIQFQSYGVALNFTPVVLSEGRISLHVATEVSQLDNTTSVTIAGTTVPGLTVRRADTTVEIPSGGTLAMAGMLQEQTKQAITGLPGLMQLPILGTLFKSSDYLNSQTELVALVTPYIVRAVAQKDLSRPDDGFADPSDPANVLLGRLNRIYGVGGIPDPPDNYRGKYGFILD
jgi:pilus assembly protein CpaC